MPHDPVSDAALELLRDILQRYLQVVDVLLSAVDALDPTASTGERNDGRTP